MRKEEGRKRGRLREWKLKLFYTGHPPPYHNQHVEKGNDPRYESRERGKGGERNKERFHEDGEQLGIPLLVMLKKETIPGMRVEGGGKEERGIKKGFTRTESCSPCKLGRQSLH